METVTKNGITYKPVSEDAALTYDSSGNVTGISKGTVEVTLENSTNPKVTLDGSTAFNFTAEAANDEIKMNFDENSGGNIIYSVTENDSSRAVDFEVKGSVLFDADGNISPLEGAVLTETFEDGNTLIVTANSDATNAINFPAENSLKFEPANADDLTLNLIFSNNRSMLVDSIEGAVSYVGDTIELEEGSNVSGKILRDKLQIPFAFDVEGGTGYSKVQAEKMIYTVDDGATLNAVNGNNEISMTAGTVTLALETDTTKIYLAEGTVMKGNSQNPVILETAGSYNMNGEQFTSTADNVVVYLTDFDTVEFESDAAIIYNGHTFDGKGNVKIVDGVLYFTMTEAGVLNLDERIFNLTENVPQGTTISLIEGGFQVSRVLSEEEVAANNWDPSDAGKVFSEVVEIANDDSYTIQVQANGIKQIDGISNGAEVQTSAIFDGEPDPEGNHFTVSTDEVGTITLGDKVYEISGDTNITFNSKYYTDDTSKIQYIAEFDEPGTIIGNFNGLSSINGGTVSIVSGADNASIVNDGTNLSIFGLSSGAVISLDIEISFVMTDEGTITVGEKTFELTEPVESGVTITAAENGFTVTMPTESGISTENYTITGDDSYSVQISTNGIEKLQGISNGASVSATAERDGGVVLSKGSSVSVVTDEEGVFTFGQSSATIKGDDSVTLGVELYNNGTTSLTSVEDLSDEGTIQIGDSILSGGVIENSKKAVQIVGTDDDDSITNTGNNVTIYGNAGDDLITASGKNLNIDAGDGDDSIVAASDSVSISNSEIYLDDGEDIIDFSGTLNQVTITGSANDINIGTLKSPLKNGSRTYSVFGLNIEDDINISVDKIDGAGLMLYLNNISGDNNANVSIDNFDGNKNIFVENVFGAVANNLVLGDITGKNNLFMLYFGQGNSDFVSNNDTITMGDIGASNALNIWLEGGNDNLNVGDLSKKVSLDAYAINSLTAEIGNIADGGQINIFGGNAENNITAGNLGNSVSFYAELQDSNDTVKIGDVGKKSNVTLSGGGGEDTFEFKNIYGNVTVTSGEPMHINRVDSVRNSGLTAESLESTAETNAIDLTISTVKANANVEITGGADADKVSIGFVELGNVSISLGAGDDSIYIDAVSDSISSNESKVSVDAGEGDNYIKLDFGYKNTITSGNGNDLVEVTRGSNMNISTGAGNDTILGVLSPTAGEDNWTFGSNAIIDGGAGNDYISPHYADNSSIFGGAGNDTIINNGANTTINGGAGNDYIELTNNLRDDTGDYEGQVIEVSAGNDTIYGANENTSIVGTFTSSSVNGDNVILTSAEGTLTIIDGKGETFYINGAETAIDENMTALNTENTVASTLIEGTAFNDTITNIGDNVTINSGEGNDSIIVVADNVLINTGEGNNTVYAVESKQLKVTTGDGDNFINGTYVKYDEERKAYVNYDSDTASTILTGAGNDTIANEGMYRSSVDAGEGDNVVGLYHSYENTVTTGAGNDSVIIGRGHKANLSTGAGNDTIIGELAGLEENDWSFGGYSTVDAGAGDDYIDTWYSDNSSIYGGAGNDTIIHNGQNTTINGGAGNDYIEFTNKRKEDTGDYESAVYIASLGYDTIKNYSSIVTLQGTFKSSNVSGNDVILKTSHGTLTILDGAGEILNLNGVESVVGEKIIAQNINNRTANTLISGTNLDDTIKNSGDNVTVIGNAGNDSIKNSSANVEIYGDEGNDKISLSSAAKNNTIYAGEGDDSIIGGGGNNLFVYAGGNDYISAYKTTDTLEIDNGEISNATLSGSNVIFTVGENNITLKGAKNKTINIIDADGNSFSTLIGGISTDATITDSDQSIIKADKNALIIDASSRTEDLQITGNSKANTIYGGSGSDTIDGGAGSDSIIGNDGADKLTGGAGNDSLYGGNGADYLEGNSGKDYLEGGAGNDTLDGGAAADTLTGGAGNDLFIYSAGKDVITDYTADEDKIKLASGKISATTYDGNDIIFKIGTGTLTVQNGIGKEITIIDSSGNETTEIYSNSNARTLDLLLDNNYMNDDSSLDDITDAKYSVTDIQDNNSEDPMQDSTLLTYGEDK